MSRAPDPAAIDWQLGVLLGGRSRRMGRDKASLPFGPGTLLDHVRRRCAPDGREVLLSVGRRTIEAPPGTRAVRDRVVDAGPLAGFEALRAASSAEWLVIVPCDMPFLDRARLERLAFRAEASGAAVVRYRVGDVLAPLPVVLGRTTTGQLARALDEGHNKLIGWEADAAEIALDPREESTAQVFLNVNDTKDLQRARALLGHVDGSRDDC